MESYNERVVAEAGIRERFVQDNHSFSVHNVLRGLHYQMRPQGKLVRVIVGEILDVAVDLRRSSPTFGSWHSVLLRRRATSCCGSRRGWRMASGYCRRVLTFSIKPAIFMTQEAERTIAWDDPVLNIDWRLDAPPFSL